MKDIIDQYSQFIDLMRRIELETNAHKKRVLLNDIKSLSQSMPNPQQVVTVVNSRFAPESFSVDWNKHNVEFPKYTAGARLVSEDIDYHVEQATEVKRKVAEAENITFSSGGADFNADME